MTPVLGRLTLPAAALVVALALSSCGTSASPSAAGQQTSGTSGGPAATAGQSPVGPPATGPSNNSDLDFAMAMTTSHLQTGAMADLAAQRAKAKKIKTLAPQIKKAQGPEVTAMAGWIVGAGLPVPGVTGGHDMSAMGGAKMQIVISPQELAALGKATGAGFDRMWLQLMLKSHRATVVIARTELAKGLNADAKKIAQSVIDRHSAQIATMTSILTGLAKG